MAVCVCSLARPKCVELTPAVLLARPGSWAPPTVGKIKSQEGGGGGGWRESGGERELDLIFDSNQWKMK